MMKRKPWQRLTLSLIGIGVIALMWRWATFHLYTLPLQSIAAFTVITTHSLYAICAIAIFMVTGRLIYDWKNSSVATVTQLGEHTVTQLGEHIIGRRVDPKDVDDQSV